MTLYFAYGSNLDTRDLAGWCSSHNCEPPQLRTFGRAWLPDAELCFRYLSRSRGCGVLDFRARRGSVVPGVLFHVEPQAAWTVLDAKEGAPTYYSRCERIVVGEDGAEHAATTYEVVHERIQDFVAPSDEYLGIVRAGLAAHGVPDDHLTAAARNEAGALAPPLLVYGTLQAGEARHEVLTRHGARLIGDAQVDGMLIDLGEYPGLVTSAVPRPVRGELYELPDTSAVLDETDAIEGFRGFGLPDSLYRRTLLPVRSAGGVVRAWTYLFAGGTGDTPVISSGDWRRR